MFKQLFNDFRKFLINPQQIIDEPQPRPLRTWLSVLAFDIAISVALIIPLIYLIDNYVLHLRQAPETSKPMTFWFMVLIIVGVAPFVEEIAFRYPLKFARNRVLKLSVYVSSIVFGLYHLSNYANREVLFFALSPIIVSSQLIGGFLLAYLRLKHGLRWSISAHAVFNALVVIPSALLLQGNTTIDHVSADYSLIVKEYVYLEGPGRMQIHRKNGGINTIVVRQVGLRTVLDSIGAPGAYYVENVLVDIDFTAASPMLPDSLVNRLRWEYRIIPQIR